MEEANFNNSMGVKLKTSFAIFVMFVLMAAVAIVFLGIEMPVNNNQQQQQQQDSDVTPSSSLPISKLTGLVEEELENQNSLFLEKPTTANESQIIGGKEEPDPFSEMNCKQLSDIASSFEDGWGKALAEFSARCEGSDEAEIEQQIRSMVK